MLEGVEGAELLQAWEEGRLEVGEEEEEGGGVGGGHPL